MVLSILGALVIGVLYGMWDMEIQVIEYLIMNTQYILYGLMFCVGISVGLQSDLISDIKVYKWKVCIIPVGVIVGSVLGGIVCGYFLSYDMHESIAVAGSMGWYSLSGVALATLGGPTLGSVAFLSNLMREVISFICIPFLAKYINAYTAIAPGGATTEDTTLPVIMKYTNEQTAVLAVINGVVCSSVVPVIIALCFGGY